VSGAVKSQDTGFSLAGLSREAELSDDDDNDDDGNNHAEQGKPSARSWSSLPKPQNIVRCPPVNWSQYAVVGESLDKLHAEQISHPAAGAPATIGPQGTYEFKASEPAGERYEGVAVPFDPRKDKINRNAKSKP
jgi:hypothetical protein